MAVGLIAWAPVQAASHFLFKGFNISDSCLEALLPAGPKAPVPARNPVLSCSAIPYRDSDTLIYAIADDSCATLTEFNANSLRYPRTVYVPQTVRSGTIEEVSDGLFIADDHAFLQLDFAHGEVSLIASTVCAPAGPPADPDVLAQLDYLKASNIGPGDRFGDQVAVSGETIVIGTKWEDGSAATVNGPGDDLATDSGAAYVFVRDGNSAHWFQQAYLKASDGGAGDNFGVDVAIDDDTIVVGADGANFAAGAAYVYVRDGNDWTEQAILSASGTSSGDRFGVDVAVSGHTAVVGAFRDDVAYVFERDPLTGQWTEEAMLTGSNTESGDSFGRDVTIDGDTIVVGAFAEDSDATGVNGAEDNNNALRSGAAYVFVRDGVNWTQQAYIKASNTDPSDQFGGELSLSGDTLAVGVFHERSNATGINGDESNDALTDAGAAYVFVRDGETWSQQAYIKASNTGFNDIFGAAVWISGDRLAISAPREDSGTAGDESDNTALDSGAVYVFMRDGVTWSQVAYLKASNLGAGDWFGRDLGMSGAILAVGGYQEDSGSPDDQSDNSAEDAGAGYVINVPASGTPGEDTEPPVVTAPPDIVGFEAEGALTSVELGAATVTDNSGESLLANPDDPGPFPIGNTIVTWTATDSAGNTGTDEQLVNIVDTTDPIVTPPPDIFGTEATGPLTPVTLGTATAFDNSGESLVATPDDPGPFPVGVTIVTWSATDSSGNEGSAQQQVGIVDTTDPVTTAPADVTATATGILTTVALGKAAATDNAGPVASLVSDAPQDGFPVGETIVTWTATDASGNSDSDTQTVTITPTEILVPDARRRPNLDGVLRLGEWKDAVEFDFQNGFAAFMHDRNRLYVLIDMLGDGGDDPFGAGGGDQFWLYFDVDEDGQITPNVDLRFVLESGTGNMRKQTYCDGCPFGFNPLEPGTFSARAEGFGCFIDDGTVSFIPLQCSNHRIWELAIDLAEIGMRVDSTARFGMLVSSGVPSFTENAPSNLDDMANYGLLTLEGTPEPLGPGPGPINPQFEVTQAIQTTDNALDLVAGKRTAVRIWDEGSAARVKAYVYGSRNGIDLTGSPLLNVSWLSDAYTGKSRNSVIYNVFFVLPQAWSDAGQVDFDIQLRGLDDSTAASLGADMSFVTTRTPVFWTVPIRNHFPSGAIEQIPANRLTLAEQQIGPSSPVQDIDVVRRPLLNVNNVTTSAALKEILRNYDAMTVLAWLIGLVNTGSPPFDLPEQTTGFTATGFGTTAGSSDPTWFEGDGRISWVAGDSSTLLTYAHEINHNLDRDVDGNWGRHAPGCDTPGQDPSWPHGADFTIQESGVRPDSLESGFRSVSDDTPDLMSYCFGSLAPKNWWSPYRWQAWMNTFRTGGEPPLGNVLEPEDTFYIQGRVYPDDTGELVQVLRQPGLPDPTEIAGAYIVRVLDCSLSVLAESRFDAVFEDVEGEPQEFFSFAMELPAPATSCHIQLALDEMVLFSQAISANPPSVTILSPNGGELWSGTQFVEWTADDPDVDTLKFTLLYSDDDGMTWQLVASMIEDTQYEIDSDLLPASEEARIRVIASDGANTVHDDSDAAFVVPLKPPVIEILFPADDTTVSASHEITLVGLARDTYGHVLPPDSLLWSIDGMPVGMDAELPVFLPEGAHEVSLAVLDGETLVTSTTIEVTASNAASIFGFVASHYETDESAGEVTLTVARQGGALGPASVLFHTADGTAVAGGDVAVGADDYVPVLQGFDNALEWADGDSSDRTITILINADDVIEEEETFEVVLTPPGDEQIGTGTATVRIGSETMEVIFSDGFE